MDEVWYFMIGCLLGIFIGVGIGWGIGDYHKSELCAAKGGVYIESHCLKAAEIKDV